MRDRLELSAGRVAMPATPILSATTTLVLTGYLLTQCGRGFDLTDQAFYLNFISRPTDYPVSVTQFGYLYHPLFVFVREDVTSLRQANLILTFALATLAAYSTLRRIAALVAPSHRPSHIDTLLLAITAGAPALLSVLLLNMVWLPTPSYNTLAYQGLLITASGFCLADERRFSVGNLGWILLGLGGFLVFMAKPTSALALSAIVLLGLLVDGRLQVRGLAIASTVAIVLAGVASFAISGGPLTFFRHLQTAAETAAKLGGGHTASGILRWDAFGIGLKGWLSLAALTAAISVPEVLAALASTIPRAMGAIAAMAMTLVAAALVSGVLSLELKPDDSIGLQSYAFLAVALIGLAAFGPSIRRNGFRHRIALIFVLSLMPVAYTFGTNNNYWHGAATAVFFLVLACLAAYARPETDSLWPRRLAPLVTAALVMSAVFIQHGLKHPYRDTGSLAQNTSAITVGRKATTINVTPQFAAYLGGLQRAAREAGFTPDTPMVDLTGHYPGTLFALGAKPIGAPWLIGGYPGSEGLARLNLDRVACAEWAEAWLLRESEGPRKLPDDLLANYGIDVARDYTIIATIDSPAAEYPTSYKQDLLKPARGAEAAETSCRKARGNAATSPSIHEHNRLAAAQDHTIVEMVAQSAR